MLMIHTITGSKIEWHTHWIDGSYPLFPAIDAGFHGPETQSFTDRLAFTSRMKLLKEYIKSSNLDTKKAARERLNFAFLMVPKAGLEFHAQ